MSGLTRAQKEAKIKTTTFIMWGAIIFSIIAVSGLFYFDFVRPQQKPIFAIGFVIATLWNLNLCRTIIKRLRTSLDDS